MAGAKSGVTGESWETLRDEAIEELNGLIEAVVEARDNLHSYQSVLEKNRRHLGKGGRVNETPAMFDIRAVRTALTERLDRLERARNSTRLALWRLQLAEDTKISEIARMWGFSRQLVSRSLSSRQGSEDG